MRPFVARISLLSLLLLSAGCAARPGTTGQRVDRDLITQDQIRQNGYRTAYEAVEALRASWLVTRPDGLSVEREKLVYLDERRLGGVQTLREIASSQIMAIRHIDPATAINRWGVDHGQGVIMVVTRR
jgi:hypothetical protein